MSRAVEMMSIARDDRGLRVLASPNYAMKEVIDNKIWGNLFKLLLVITPLTLPIFVHIYGTLNAHDRRLENLTEWRRGHSDVSAEGLARLSAVEKALASREVEVAVMREKLTMFAQSSERTAATLAVMSDQLVQMQRSVVEMKGKLDELKSKQ